MVSGMHVQAPQIRDISARAQAAGKAGGARRPVGFRAPEMYPEIDYLHIGEIGDATDALIARLDASVAPPPAQIALKTEERLPLDRLPACPPTTDPARRAT